MATSNYQITYAFKANEALNDTLAGTGHLYKAITVNSGLIANAGDTATGVLIQPTQNGNNGTIAVVGFSKYTAGAAVTVGARLTVTTSGYFTVAASGDVVVGQNLKSAVTSGSVGEGYFHFAKYAINDA